MALEVFHFDISGNEDKFSHSENIPLILITLEVFHIEISGNEDNELHSQIMTPY